MSQWTKFTVSKKAQETACGDITGRSSRMGLGIHIGVKIIKVSPVEGHPACDLLWQSDAGDTQRQRIFVTMTNRETNEEGFSSRYTFLGSALTGAGIQSYSDEQTANAVQLCQEFFFTRAVNEGILLEKLIGCRANIEIRDPESGFKIKRLANGLAVFDHATNSVREELNPDTGGVFATYELARAAADENNYAMKYPEVKRIIANEEYVNANQEQLRAALKGGDGTKTIPGINLATVQGL